MQSVRLLDVLSRTAANSTSSINLKWLELNPIVFSML